MKVISPGAGSRGGWREHSCVSRVCGVTLQKPSATGRWEEQGNAGTATGGEGSSRRHRGIKAAKKVGKVRIKAKRKQTMYKGMELETIG